MEDVSDIVIMLARQRSGTNALRSVLSRHPKILCMPEVFQNQHDPASSLSDGEHRFTYSEVSYFTFLERYGEGRLREVLSADTLEQVFLDFLQYLRCFSSRPYTLLDVKFRSVHHISRAWHFMSETPLLFDIAKRHRIRVLLVKRRNLLRYYLSDARALATQVWHQVDETVVGRKPRGASQQHAAAIEHPFAIDCADMLASLRLCDAEDRVVSESFAGYEHLLELDYTDFDDGVHAGLAPNLLRSVTDWMGLAPLEADTRPRYRKQSSLPLHEAIANYEEVRLALRGSPWEWCLEDEPGYRADRSSPLGQV